MDKFRLESYLDRSGRAMLAAGLAYDHARAAEKMSDWDCVGNSNFAWTEGPYLSSPANEQQIDHSFPYCFRSSDYFSQIAVIVLGPNPTKAKNGGVQIPLPEQETGGSKVEPVVSKLAIIEQHELFKDFLQSFNGPYNKKQRIKWENIVQKDILDRIEKLTNRRNNLIHDIDHNLTSMEEAVSYFYQLKQIAEVLFTASKEQEK